MKIDHLESNSRKGTTLTYMDPDKGIHANYWHGDRGMHGICIQIYMVCNIQA